MVLDNREGRREPISGLYCAVCVYVSTTIRQPTTHPLSPPPKRFFCYGGRRDTASRKRPCVSVPACHGVFECEDVNLPPLCMCIRGREGSWVEGAGATLALHHIPFHLIPKIPVYYTIVFRLYFMDSHSFHFPLFYSAFPIFLGSAQEINMHEHVFGAQVTSSVFLH